MLGALNHVAIAVPDLAAAADRYAELGAKVSAPQDLPEHGVTVVFVELPNTKIELLHPFGDLGFEVLVGPLFQTPEEAADLAVASKVEVVGMSSLAAGHKTLAPALVAALRERGAENVVVVVGGVVPRQDYDFLMENGVAAVFGPGTNVLDAANAVLDLVDGRIRNQ